MKTCFVTVALVLVSLAVILLLVFSRPGIDQREKFGDRQTEGRPTGEPPGAFTLADGSNIPIPEPTYSFSSPGGVYSPWYSTRSTTDISTIPSGEGSSEQATKRGIGNSRYYTYMNSTVLPNSFGDDALSGWPSVDQVCPGQVSVCLCGNRYREPPTFFDREGKQIVPITIYDSAKRLKYTYIFCGVPELVFKEFYVQTSEDLPFTVCELRYPGNATSSPVTGRVTVSKVETFAGRTLWSVNS